MDHQQAVPLVASIADSGCLFHLRVAELVKMADVAPFLRPISILGAKSQLTSRAARVAPRPAAQVNGTLRTSTQETQVEM